MALCQTSVFCPISMLASCFVLFCFVVVVFFGGGAEVTFCTFTQPDVPILHVNSHITILFTVLQHDQVKTLLLAACTENKSIHQQPGHSSLLGSSSDMFLCVNTCLKS